MVSFQGNDLFPASGRHTDDHQASQTVFFQAHPEVHTIGPDIGIVLVLQRTLPHLFRSLGLQASDILGHLEIQHFQEHPPRPLTDKLIQHLANFRRPLLSEIPSTMPRAYPFLGQ